MAISRQTQSTIAIAATAAVDKLASDLMVIDIADRMPFAEAFFICSAPTARQVRAIAENIKDELGIRSQQHPERMEGREDARWMLLDYGDLIVHVMMDEDREYYALESVWADECIHDAEQFLSDTENANSVRTA